MTTQTKSSKRLTKTATERVNRLRDTLTGTNINTRGTRKTQKGGSSSILYGAALHATARFEAGYELSDLEQTLVEGLGKTISPEETREWGKVYRETPSAQKKQLLSDIIAERPLDQPFTMQDLVDSLPAQIQEVKAQGNVRIVDVSKLGPDEPLDQRDEALLAAEKQYGSSLIYYTSSAPPPAPEPSSTEAVAGEVMSGGEIFIVQPFKMQTIVGSGDTKLGPSDEIFWSMSSSSDEEQWTFRSREFGSCDAGDWDYFHPNELAFVGRVNRSLVMSIECWEKDSGEIFNGISNFMFDVSRRCLEAATKLAGSDADEGAVLGVLASAVSYGIAHLLRLFNNADDFVASRQVGWSRDALRTLAVNGREAYLRFDGESANGMGIQDLYLRFAMLPTGPFRIVSKKSNKDITIDAGSNADYAEAHQWTSRGVNHQKYTLMYTGAGYFGIRTVHSGKFLDVFSNSSANSAKIVQYPWNGGGNQCFRLEPLGGQLYRISVKHTGKVLDVQSGSTNDGALIVQYPWGNAENQKWKIVPA